MTIMVIYKKDSEQYRPVQEFLRMMRTKYADKDIAELDPETREGAYEAQVFGVMQYPAVVVKAETGELMNIWQGLPLPLVDEVVAATLA